MFNCSECGKFKNELQWLIIYKLLAHLSPFWVPKVGSFVPEAISATELQQLHDLKFPVMFEIFPPIIPNFKYHLM